MSTENHWELVQLSTGKVVRREDAEPVKELRWVCPDPGHSGGFPKEGVCRICETPLVQEELVVRWKEK